jgi:hypothetical protein
VSLNVLLRDVDDDRDGLVSCDTQREGGLSMPVVHACEEPGCVILTMGQFCVEHERVEALTTALHAQAASAALEPLWGAAAGSPEKI